MAAQTISRIDWENYIRTLRNINEAAAQELIDWIETYGRDENGFMLNNIMEAVDAYDNDIIDEAYLIAEKYGNASAAISAEMYEATAELEGKIIPAAEMAANPSYSEVRKTVFGTLKTSTNVDELAGAVSRLVKRTGVDTTMQNALRDGAQWAWIPHGETCAFCLTLASRGWQNASKKALKNGHAEHIHANCDCTYAIRFDGRSDVEGYNPDVYKKMYYDAPGAKPKDKINAMRRELYEENKEAINEQKRSAYEKRKEREASSAEEINVST